ncbi:MAG TPA: DUF2442 domain-containing protein [Chlamydiales bacterium]|nr:DUF2442 domain-containing protein [Chlamydiales bacterium]
MHRVKKVECLDWYRLKLYFSNREVRTIDLSDELKNAKNLFLDLIDIEYFKKVECDGISIVWPNGIDFCPDWLYMNSKRESKSLTLSSKRKIEQKKKYSRKKPIRKKISVQK